MPRRVRATIAILSTISLSLASSACVPSGPWRPVPGPAPHSCAADQCCDRGVYSIERYDAGYSLSFIEFTELGNLVDPETVVATREEIDFWKKRGDLITLVYVHGFLHDARPGDDNVQNFRKTLSVVSKLEADLAEAEAGRPARRVLGIYVGWRGAVTYASALNVFTFWDRKAVAERIGNAGLTDLLLRLGARVIDWEDREQNNVIGVVGHSLGGTILVSAVDELVLSRLRDPKAVARPFAHAVIALNPAVEANEVLPIRNVSLLRAAASDEGTDQPKLLHIVSTQADNATRVFFELARRLRFSVFWSAPRQAYAGGLRFDERSLGIRSAGNHSGLRSGRMRFVDADEAWCYAHCNAENEGFCYDEDESEEPKLFDVENEAVEVIYADSAFMSEHSDIFNSSVLAYLATLITEGRHDICRQIGGDPEECARNWGRCDLGRGTPFPDCFKTYQEKIRKIVKSPPTDACEAKFSSALPEAEGGVFTCPHSRERTHEEP